MPWAKRHPGWTLAYLLFGVIFLVTGEGVGILLGILILIHVFFLFRTPLSPRRKPVRRASSQPTSKQISRSSAPAARIDRPSTARSSLAIGDPATRIALTNALEVDEPVDFAVPGNASMAIVGTDRRLFVASQSGWRAKRPSLLSTPYAAIDKVLLEQQRHHVVIQVETIAQSPALPPISFASEEQISHAISIVPEIRRRSHLAKQAERETPAPASQSSFVETAHQTLPQRIGTKTISLGDMLSMGPTEFEVFTGRALTALGYTEVSRVGGAGDLAADLTAHDPQGRSSIVQCKRYTPGSKVSSPTLQSFIGMKAVHHKADRGIFVTTADYTRQAIDLAKHHDIVLIDGDDLVKIAALVLTEPSSSKTDMSTGSQTTDRKFCNQCGTPLDHEARFCPQCGRAALEPQITANDHATQINP